MTFGIVNQKHLRDQTYSRHLGFLNTRDTLLLASLGRHLLCVSTIYFYRIVTRGAYHLEGLDSKKIIIRGGFLLFTSYGHFVILITSF